MSVFSKMNNKDIVFVDNYLDAFEKEYFYRLKESEQKHCVRVALLAERMAGDKNLNRNRLVKAGLLHDVGKGIKKINILEKVIMVILNKLFSKKMLVFKGFDFIDSYYNHGSIGYNVLKSHIRDEKLLEIILYHHSNIEGNAELDIIKYCDSKN